MSLDEQKTCAHIPCRCVFQRIRNIVVRLVERPEQRRLRLRVSAITPRARLRRDYSSQEVAPVGLVSESRVHQPPRAVVSGESYAT